MPSPIPVVTSHVQFKVSTVHGRSASTSRIYRVIATACFPITPIMRPLIANLNRRTRRAFARHIDKSNRQICSPPIQAVRVTWSQKRLGRSKWLDWSLVLRSTWSRTDHRRVTISIYIKRSGRDSESPSSPSTVGLVAWSTTGSLIVVDCSAIIIVPTRRRGRRPLVAIVGAQSRDDRAPPSRDGKVYLLPAPRPRESPMSSGSISLIWSS